MIWSNNYEIQKSFFLRRDNTIEHIYHYNNIQTPMADTPL